MRNLKTVLALGAAAVALAACSATLQLSQTPAAVQETIRREVKDGNITDIEQKNTKGLVYYEVRYDRGGDSYEMEVSDHGEIMKKDRD